MINMTNKFTHGVYQYSATNYIYYEKFNNNTKYDYGNDAYNNDTDNNDADNEYSISLQNYIFLDENQLPEIISNYYISDPVLDKVCYFASIIWNKINYIDDDYDPYNYDPDPKCIIYIDNFDDIVKNKYLFIIDELNKKFYSPITHYKHFNPELEKISLSDIKNNDNYKYIVKNMNELIEKFT